MSRFVEKSFYYSTKTRSMILHISSENMLPEESMQQDIKLDKLSVDEKMHRFCCRSNSDVLIRIITREGRDDPFYCHSQILKAKSTYFEDHLSNNQEPAQSFKLYCEESEVDHYTQVLRLCYTDAVKSLDEIRQQSVRNATGILRVAVKLGCQHLVTACVNYLEAVPWDDLEEDEILRTIPKLGPEAASTLARVKPVDLEGLKAVLISALRLATSPSQSISDLKSCIKEKIMYMLSKHHDDAPLLIASNQVKSEITECTTRLFSRFHDLLDSCSESSGPDKAAKILLIPSCVSDLLWFFRVVRKLDLMAIIYFIVSWLEVSEKVVKVFRVEKLSEETNLRLIEVAAKVLEPIGKGMIILPTSTRVHALKVWVPFVRWAKPLIDEAELEPNLESQLWVPLQATFVKLIHSIPSVEQTQVLTEWLDGRDSEYPDLTRVPTFHSSNDIEEDDSTQSDGSMFSNDNEEGASDDSMSSDEIEEGANT